MSFTAYIDETGNDEHFVLASLVATHGEWMAFIDAWETVLLSPKSLNPGKKGRIYYRAYDADHRQGCFRGFHREQAQQKTQQLLETISRHPGIAIICSVPHDAFDRIVRHRVSTVGKVKPPVTFRHPYFFLFRSLMAEIVARKRDQQPIDFVFDENGFGERWLHLINSAKRRFSPKTAAQVGQIIQSDDTISFPLQAVDLVASRMRKRLAGQSERFSEALQARLFHRQYRNADLEKYMTGLAREWNRRTLSPNDS